MADENVTYGRFSVRKNRFKYIDQKIPREDGANKIFGRVKYPSDYYFENQLWLSIKRSIHSHAKILKINREKAEKLKGVVRVMTYRDIPGLNGFGIAIQDQPVFCHNKVRYVGDAIAAVAAESKEIAKRALSLIDVEYELLPSVVDPESAMKKDSPLVHENGNILHEVHFNNGDIERAFRDSELTFKERYSTPRIAHLFLETEAGVAFYDEDGLLTIRAGGQYPHRDRMQIARALGLKNEGIRILSSPIGGGFGGKDEVTVQIFLALTTYLTKRPCRIFLEREESLIAGMKRHPMKIELKTAIKSDGSILGINGNVISDTGAYASLGGPILNLCVEHICGPYRVQNCKVDGYAVYTNNGVSAAFRGFGVPQAAFALESEIDKIAQKLGIDPIDFRIKNCLESGDSAGLGYKIPTSVGIKHLLMAAKNHPIYKNRKKLKRQRSGIPKDEQEHSRRGIGFACAMQGYGLGVGIPDYADAKIKITRRGEIILYIGGCEMGQGLGTAAIQIAAEELECNISDISVIVGDTKIGPDSGPSTASRSTYATGNAIINAVQDLKNSVSKFFNIKVKNLLKDNKNFILNGKKYPFSMIKDDIIGHGNFVIPTSEVELGDGLPHILYCFGAHLVMLDVNLLTGNVTVERVVAFIDPGRVINRLGIEGQSEGGVIMGMGYALYEDFCIRNGTPQNFNLSTYIIPTAHDSSFPIETITISDFEKTGPYQAKGVGEITMVSVAPAIANAIYDAIGIRFSKIPVLPEMILEKIYN